MPLYPGMTLFIEKLVLYLFALWESHLPEGFKEWMSESELQEFEAFEHTV